jgi:hypothetical protein
MRGPCKSLSPASHHHTSPTCHGTHTHLQHSASDRRRILIIRILTDRVHTFVNRVGNSRADLTCLELCVMGCGRHEVLTCLDDDEGIQAEVYPTHRHTTPHSQIDMTGQSAHEYFSPPFTTPYPLPLLSICVLMCCVLSLSASCVGGVSDVAGHPPCHDSRSQAPDSQGSTRHTPTRQVQLFKLETLTKVKNNAFTTGLILDPPRPIPP